METNEQFNCPMCEGFKIQLLEVSDLSEVLLVLSTYCLDCGYLSEVEIPLTINISLEPPVKSKQQVQTTSKLTKKYVA